MVNEHEDDIKLAKLLTHKKGIYLNELKYPFLSYTYIFINAFFSDVRKKGNTELKRLVSIVQSKNRKKKIISSSDRLKPQSQESPKVREVTNKATTSKASSSNTSLVNYDSSSTDSDT